MAKREVIATPGAPVHLNPLPQAVKMGNTVFSSSIVGRDPVTRIYPASIEAQVRNAFASMRALVESAGGSTADIAQVGIYLQSRNDRKYVNPVWEEMFPDPSDRPARLVLRSELDDGAKIILSFTAIL